MVQATIDRSTRVKVIPALAAGLGRGMLFGVAIRAWMRLISETPEFTLSGTMFIVIAGSLAGLGAALAAVARRNRWRFGKVASVVGGVLFIGLGTGAGAILMVTVVLLGVAIGRPRITLPLRLLVAGFAAMVAFAMIGLELPASGFVWAIAGVPLLIGWRPRLMLTVLGLIPVGFVLWGVLTSELPLWQRFAGTAAYPLLVAPVLLWFSRTVSPFPKEAR
jgi:hypothetical protein